MKKTNLLLAIITMMFIASCSNDDDTIVEAPIPEAPISVVLNEIEFLGDRVEILNTGSAVADINDYFLCLGPGTYRRIGDLTNETASIDPGSFLVVTYDQLNTSAGQINDTPGTGGLGLYTQGGSFGDPSTLADFVQWGAAGSIRETTAVDAGIWTTGEFVTVTTNTGTSIIYDGTGDTAADFSETTTPSFGEANGNAVAPLRSIVLNEVEYLGDRVEILNTGNVSADISGYFLCLGPGTYRQLSALPAVSGSTTLAPGEFLVVTYDQLNADAGQINNVSGTGGLGLYINNTGFADPTTISDFVQWGAAGSVRETTAVEAGIWTAGEFVSVVNGIDNSIIFDGEGDVAADWEETATPSFGEANGNAVAPVRSIVLNEVEYLGDRVEILNNGNSTADVSGYFLCLGPGTYRQLSALPAVSGSTTLAPGEFLVVTYDQLNVTAGQISGVNGTGGLGLYINNTGFANPDTISDFVQWGAAGSVRETTAVAAGIWTAGEFVSVANVEDTSIVFDGEGDTAADFSETITPSFGAENGAAVPPVRSIVLNEVEYLGDRVEILNNGNVSADISGYFLCLGPGTYRQLSALPAVSGSTTLAPGEFLVVTYDQLNVTAGQISGVNGTGGLGLYINNTGFANPDTISDFVQWGAAGSVRETTAVAAGIWTAGEFVTVVNDVNNSIIFDGEGDTAADFAETTTPSFGAENGDAVPPAVNSSVVINEIQFNTSGTGGQIEIFNNGNVNFDLSDHWLCLGSGTYRQIGNAASVTVVSGNIDLAPGEYLVIEYPNLNVTDGGFGLYSSNAFGSSAAMVDFVQWGDGGNQREPVAVGAGLWTAGDFIPQISDINYSFAFDGEGNTSADWFEESSPTLGAANN
ncbi:hypothetical protein D7030_02875 [Flavobacteriaceae bacterium AU392]|nr:hypothetical protein D7030_02875 [Flavobacteriaceae bacterium AU392]